MDPDPDPDPDPDDDEEEEEEEELVSAAINWANCSSFALIAILIPAWQCPVCLQYKKIGCSASVISICIAGKLSRTPGATGWNPVSKPP